MDRRAHDQMLRQLRGDLRSLVIEPIVPTETEIAEAQAQAMQPRPASATEGLPVDHFWREEAERLQSMSGEGSQE